jgi:hypothetical protein
VGTRGSGLLKKTSTKKSFAFVLFIVMVSGIAGHRYLEN